MDKTKFLRQFSEYLSYTYERLKRNELSEDEADNISTSANVILSDIKKQLALAK